MNTRFLGLLVACACVSPSVASAAKVEADFNDLKVGDTRTKNASTSPNNGTINTGTGFLPATNATDGGPGEYNNNTGVVQFERGDLPVPPGIVGFTSQQETPADPTSPQGIVFGSSVETAANDNQYRRYQERQLAETLDGPEIWFSFLFRLDGPNGDGRIRFNVPSGTDSDAANTSAAFSISLGHKNFPGSIGLITVNNANDPNGAVGDAGLLYYDDLNNNGVIDGTEVDLNGNGQIDGIDVGKGSAANITSHLIIGKVTLNAAGDDLIEIWLDPANASNLGAPTLTGLDEVGTGINSIAFEGTRHRAPSPTGGPYTSGGHSAIDHFRMSDDADAFEFITGNVVVDPKLIVSPTVQNPDTNFTFGGVYGSGSPITSAPKTVVLANAGVNNSITINSVTLGATPTDNPFQINSGAPITLAPGESTTVTVTASSDIVDRTFSNTVVIDTDADGQDITLAASATFYRNGSRLNRNQGFERDLGDWLSDDYIKKTPAVRVSPGFFGSNGMVLMHGTEHANGPDNLSQTLLNGAADWEFAFAFSPIRSEDFESYTGVPIQSGDRTFQVAIQSDGDIPTPAAGTEGTYTDRYNADAALINLAYMPENGGFCVYNGSNWQSIGLPLITGSTDATKNGILSAGDPAGADTVNAYMVRIKGTGFGTPSAKYSVSVSSANTSVPQATAENLTIFSMAQGSTNTPGSYTFTTGDISSSGGAKTTSYWIDEVSFFAGNARDPDLVFGGDPTIISHNGVSSPAMIQVTNIGASQNLDVSQLRLGKPDIFTSTTTAPFVIAPGQTVSVPVALHIENMVSTDTAVFTDMTLDTNVPLQVSHAYRLYGSATSDSNLLANWNFEIPGADQGSDFDTFQAWNEYGVVNLSKDMPGLIGSGKGVHIADKAAIDNTFGAPASDFVMEAFFAVRNTSLRALNLTVQSTEKIGDNFPQINLRYEGSRWQAYSAAWEDLIDMTANPLVPSVDANGDLDLEDAGDTKSVYKLRITGKGWGSATPTYQLEILDLANTVIASSAADIAIYQGGTPTSGANLVSFRANSATNAGFWLDDVLVYSTVVSEGVTITSISGGAGNFTLNWDSGGLPVTIERSTTLEAADWTPVSENNTAGPFTDTAAPNGRAFYRVRLAIP